MNDDRTEEREVIDLRKEAHVMRQEAQKRHDHKKAANELSSLSHTPKAALKWLVDYWRGN
jgi:hypothetical protein